jgi:hypothetical protein
LGKDLNRASQTAALEGKEAADSHAESYVKAFGSVPHGTGDGYDSLFGLEKIGRREKIVGGGGEPRSTPRRF